MTSQTDADLERVQVRTVEGTPAAHVSVGLSGLRRRLTARLSLEALPSYSGVLAALIVLVLVLALTQPQFSTTENILNILRTSAIPMMLAIGVTFTILLGGIDLSVGSLLALSGVVLFGLLGVVPEPVAVLGAVLFGAALGALTNGLFIGWLRLPPLVTTLGTLAAFRGFAYIFTDGTTKYVDRYPLVADLGDGSVGGVPIPVIIVTVVAALAVFTLRATYFGRDVYAIGGNREAARLSGIPIARVTVLIYLVSGATAGLAGVMQAGRLASVSPGVAQGLELYVAAAVLLGGTSLAGGRGGIVGTVVGVLLLVTIENGLTLIGVLSYWQQVVTGSILVIAVLLDRLREQLIIRRGAKAALS